MIAFNLLVAGCLAYVALLFTVAFLAERRAERGPGGWLRSPVVYTLSLSIYCTAWTFYGAVGNAARNGLEFITIYLGPSLVFIGWWALLRKLVHIGRAQRVTSIADLISSRYGKSNLLGVIVTLIAVAAYTPYIALQLQSVTLSFGVFASNRPEGWALSSQTGTAMWVAGGLALFTILFGTRNLDSNERHHGVVMAIALEAVVKLVALMAVGIWVVWGLAGGVAPMLAQIEASPLGTFAVSPPRWIGLTFASAAAIVTLPRMFQVMVVENADPRHLSTAAWAFPLYLLAMSLFVLPIAVMGLTRLPQGANPDLFVLTLPLAEGQGRLAILAFLGGFSSATSMVIVAAIALSTMVSNHIITPLWLALRRGGARAPGDLRGLVLTARRVAILAVLALGYLYYTRTGGSAALASIGLISFVGAAQVLPAMLGGLYWRGATRLGAIAGLLTGFCVWLYALFLPSFGPDVLLSGRVLAQGPFGLAALRPQALFGLSALDPLLHALILSLALNTLAFIGLSLVTFPSPVERSQGLAFVNAYASARPAREWERGGAEAEDLLAFAQSILGDEPAQEFFQREAAAQGNSGFLPDVTPAFLSRLERRLAGAMGAATAHAMIGQFAGAASVTMSDLMAVAGEAQQIIEQSQRLEAQSEELTRTAAQLREANQKLTELSERKDSFLSQISHELRTPMTSIRAFSEILSDPSLPPETQQRYAGIVQEEAIRLTRLLDDLLDLSVLESRQADLRRSVVNLSDLITRAIRTAAATRPERSFTYDRDIAAEQVALYTDADRLGQVLLNIITNARKYCDAPAPVLRITARRRRGRVEIDIADNGSGIPRAAQAVVFEKFTRLTDTQRAGGAGLGLAICREIMANLGGTIAYLPGQRGAAFRLSLPDLPSATAR